jgi:transcriptional regulator with XRE-family HTH domain
VWYKEAYDNLKKYRLNHGLSQEEMAVRLGLKNFQAYQYYEMGNLRLRKAREFSIILSYDLTQINDGENIEATITVILRYLAKIKAKEERLSLTTAFNKLLEEIELEKMVSNPAKSPQS